MVPGMYQVESYLRVRRAVMVEGMSIREASRVFGLLRDTGRKMLVYSIPPGYRRQTTPRCPNPSTSSGGALHRRHRPDSSKRTSGFPGSSATRPSASSSASGTSTPLEVGHLVGQDSGVGARCPPDLRRDGNGGPRVGSAAGGGRRHHCLALCYEALTRVVESGEGCPTASTNTACDVMRLGCSTTGKYNRSQWQGCKV